MEQPVSPSATQLAAESSLGAMKRDHLVVLYLANAFAVESARDEQVVDFCAEKVRLFDKLAAWIRHTFNLLAILAAS